MQNNKAEFVSTKLSLFVVFSPQRVVASFRRSRAPRRTGPTRRASPSARPSRSAAAAVSLAAAPCAARATASGAAASPVGVSIGWSRLCEVDWRSPVWSKSIGSVNTKKVEKETVFVMSYARSTAEISPQKLEETSSRKTTFFYLFCSLDDHTWRTLTQRILNINSRTSHLSLDNAVAHASPGFFFHSDHVSRPRHATQRCSAGDGRIDCAGQRRGWVRRRPHVLVRCSLRTARKRPP